MGIFKSWDLVQREQLMQYKIDLINLTDSEEIQMLEDIIQDLEFEINNNSNN